jgi:two-component sensor histidine kinase
MQLPMMRGGADQAFGLARAVVMSANTPLLLLDGGLGIIAASDSFCRVFRLDPARVLQCRLSQLGAGGWGSAHLATLLAATASGHADIDAYEMDVTADGAGTRRVVLNARRLDYGDPSATRLLLSIDDVTDARLAAKATADITRENAVLLQEMQHRIANSLQIIASVLLQSARRVDSSETRLHLFDAHQRVMSIAKLQQQLAVTERRDVALRAYLTELCGSISASMIRPDDRLSLDVRVDESVATAGVSTSIGLIVTELVINALKHAFPRHRPGGITVAYRAQGAGWTLSVGDNGIGMHRRHEHTKAGLGTSIIEALARQLDARIDVQDAAPGTIVSVVHEAVAAESAIAAV